MVAVRTAGNHLAPLLRLRTDPAGTANAGARAPEVWDAPGRASRALGGRNWTRTARFSERETTIPQDTRRAMAHTHLTAAHRIFPIARPTDPEREAELLEPDAVGLDQSSYQTVMDSGLAKRCLCLKSRKGHGFSPFTLTPLVKWEPSPKPDVFVRRLSGLTVSSDNGRRPQSVPTRVRLRSSATS
jgi:hypothetical protein